jgi:molybdopterin converting factor small subunit
VNVTVRLYATLRERAHAAVVDLDVPEGTTIADVARRLGLPRGAVHLAFVRGVSQDESYVLRAGDDLGMFPPIAGGLA